MIKRILMVLSATYVMFAFVNDILNPREWSLEARAFYVLLSLAFLCVTFMADDASKSNNEEIS